MSYGLSDVTVTVGSVPALAGVTLVVPSGEVTAVVGGDGAGKTTALRTLTSLLRPESGSVAAPPRERIGYQSAFGSSWSDLTVAENLAFVGSAHGLHGQALAARADVLLDGAGLSDVRGRRAGALSGGMRTKLGFCLAMLHSPDLLVLDEPSTGVDPVSRIELWRLVADAAATGAAVLVSTTYMDEAERVGSVVVLERGRVLLTGSPTDVMAQVPGVVVETASPRRPEWAWRRGARYHEWWPKQPATTAATKSPRAAQVVAADLEDAVIVAALRATSGRGPQ